MVVRGLLVSAVLVAVAGCSGPAVSPGDGPADTPTPSSAAPSDTATPVPAVASFTDKYTYPDGVEVEVVNVRHGKVSADDASSFTDLKAGQAWQQLVVRVRNGSPARLTDVYQGMVVTYGPDGVTAPTVYVPSVQGGSLSGTILQGKAKTGVDTFSIPAKDLGDVTLEFTFDGVHDAAVFTGRLP